MFPFSSNVRLKISHVMAATLVSMAAFPQHGLSQTPEMLYSASDAEIAAANCSSERVPRQTENTSEGTRANTMGTLNGRFINNSPNTPLSFAAANALFFIDINADGTFYHSLGGNAFYAGDLVLWNASWLLCPSAGSLHFNDIDQSKPYLRIFPNEDSRSHDGHYDQFRIQEFWHADAITAIASAIDEQDTLWIRSSAPQ